MIAVDTNVLARYLLADDEAQFAAAERLLSAGETCTAPLTVILELVWVLESYALVRADIVGALRALLGLPFFVAPAPLALARGIDWYAQGLDFADALHLAQSSGAERFASFDGKLAKRAARLAAVPPVVKPA